MWELFEGGINFLLFKQALVCGINSWAGKNQGNTVVKMMPIYHKAQSRLSKMEMIAQTKCDSEMNKPSVEDLDKTLKVQK